MSASTLTIKGKTVYTEADWKAKNKNWEGDGVAKKPVLILVEWDDRQETPSEAISRLNGEVMKQVETLKAVCKNNRLCVGCFKGMGEGSVCPHCELNNP